MKQKDIFAIALIAVIVAVAGWFSVNKFIATESNLSAQIEIVSPYTEEFSAAAKEQLIRNDAVNFGRDPNLNVDGGGQILIPPGE